MVAGPQTMDRTERADDVHLLRALPSVDALVRDESLVDLPPRAVVREARRVLAELRAAAAGAAPAPVDRTRVVARVRECVLAALASRHRRVINATGIVLHTGIGRAPLAAAARRAMAAAAGYAVVEVDPIDGQRNQREEAVAGLLREITGVGGALVVNNNAAAVNLTLRALAEGREVIVSRGELVEIGGGFRMPDVMAAAGCRMVEVGTTNRTHRADYATALREATALVLKIHTSNFRVLGFTSAVSVAELAQLTRESDALVFDDLGSGLLCEAIPEALAGEPTVQASVLAGADLVSFSGDKLLGGPQCGILLGSSEVVARVRSHPLYRAFRCDKLTLAALEATLQIYRDGDPCAEIPVLRAIARSADTLRGVAEELAAALPGAAVRASESFVGSGANPARAIPSWAVVLPHGARVADALRTRGPLPVFCRVADDLAWLDARTLADEDLAEVAHAVRTSLNL